MDADACYMCGENKADSIKRGFGVLWMNDIQRYLCETCYKNDVDPNLKKTYQVGAVFYGAIQLKEDEPWLKQIADIKK